MAKNGRTDAVKIYRDRAIAAEQRVGQLEAQIVHLWMHRQGCGAQSCAPCADAYNVFSDWHETLVDRD